MQDIHPIRPPIEVGFDPALLRLPAMILAGLLLALLLFFWFRSYLKKKKSPDLPAVLAPALPPFEAALNALDAMANAPGDPKTCYYGLTLILRKYIGGTFNSHAPEMTSQEFCRHVNGLDIDRSVKSGIVDFNNYCDPLKYAGIIPGEDRIREDVDRVKEMIRNIETTLEGKRKPEETESGREDY